MIVSYRWIGDSNRVAAVLGGGGRHVHGHCGLNPPFVNVVDNLGVVSAVDNSVADRESCETAFAQTSDRLAQIQSRSGVRTSDHRG